MVRMRLYDYFKSVQRKILHIDSHDKILHIDSHDKIGYYKKLPDSSCNRISSVFPPQVFA